VLGGYDRDWADGAAWLAECRFGGALGASDEAPTPGARHIGQMSARKAYLSRSAEVAAATVTALRAMGVCLPCFGPSGLMLS
jgi:hypothetical protein